ncbi:MAG: choice-of-anchor W domain-containing protein [Cyanobacteriota bacterium]
MGVSQVGFSTALLTMGLSLFPLAAQAIGLSTIASESELESLLSQPAFMAGGFIGTIALKAAENTENSVDFAWTQGEKQPFSLNYDGSTVKYTVGDKTLETQIQGAFNDIFIYAKAAEESTSVMIESLLLKDSSVNLTISGIAASFPNNKSSIFHIYDIGENFTLTGNAVLNWMNTPQNSANVGYQIQVGNVTAPTTLPVANQNQAEPVKPSITLPNVMDWFPKLNKDSFCNVP